MLLPHSNELNFTKFPYPLRNYPATLHEILLLLSETENCETRRLYVLCTSWMKRMYFVTIFSDSQPVRLCMCVCVFFRNSRKISKISSKVTSVLDLLSEFNFGLFRS